MSELPIYNVLTVQRLVETTGPYVRHLNFPVPMGWTRFTAADLLLHAAFMLRSLVSGSKLRPDASQAAAIRALSLLQTFACLKPSTSAVAAADGSTSAPLDDAHGSERPALHDTHGNERPAPSICGAYLWGPVGSGKTMCLDLFYRTLPMAGPSGGDPPFLSVAPPSRIANTSVQEEPPGSGRTSVQKRRLHFHEFMLRVHQRLHALQQGRPRVLGRSRLGLPVYRCVSEMD